MNYNKIQIGWAQTSITPNRPLIMEGQLYQRASRPCHRAAGAGAEGLAGNPIRKYFF